jgi:tetratricopeptide (TPR) repeat protein
LQPLNHYARFEKYLLLPTDENKVAFISLIRNEQPIETYLDLADTYYKTGCYEESVKALLLSPSNAMVSYKLAFFHHLLAKPYAGYLTDAEKSTVAFVFPFRSSDQDVLRWAIAEKTGWKPKYLLALLYKDRNRISESKTLFQQCGNLPDFAPFYAARAAMKLGSSDLTDLEKALQLEPDSWRYVKLLSEYQLQQKEGAKALLTVQPFYRAHPQNYVMAIIYAHTLLLNKRYEECTEVLKKTNILPFEGATRSRQLYQVAYLMQALQQIQKGHTQTALRYIDSAREWPENLGVGKPYQENVDERFEDWLSYRCYLQSGKAAEARKYLDKIIAFVPSTENSVRNFSPGNQLLTAWALKKVNGRTSALAWVKEQVKLNENDSTLQAYGNLADDNDEVPEQLGAKELMVLEQLIDIR